MVTIVLVAMACSPSPVAKVETFKEMDDPTNDTLSDWSKIPRSGLIASFVSIDDKYPRSVLPQLNRASISQKLTGWKGEKLSAQLLLWSAEDVANVTVEFSEFKSANSTMSADIAQARFVRYVMTDVFAGGCGHRKPEDFPASLTPDMLDNLPNFDMDAKTVRPVWITVEIPRSAEAGSYKSMVKVNATDEKTEIFELEILVQNKTLPTSNEWEYHLDLWQHPSAVARTQNLKLWSDAHFDALRPTMQMLADAGQKVITTNINKDPWHNQCYDAYADMIVWTKMADGTWSYDYTIFDKWVSFMLDLGINKMINCYSVVPWNNELDYVDAKTKETFTVKADPGTAVFDELWGAFLPDFVAHLKEKGWLEITNIAMDERSPESMKFTMDMLQKVAPELGISLADNHKSYQKYPHIKDISGKVDGEVALEDIEARRAKGLVTTYYVCCADKFPNVFTFSGSAEAVYTAWYAIAGNYDGYLRWAYNSWVENPLTDSRFRTWPAGDTYIVYPEARSSIRFERLVEGIQDVEKVRVLRKELKEANTPESLKKLEKLNEEVAKFKTLDVADTYISMLRQAKALINDLSE